MFSFISTSFSQNIIQISEGTDKIAEAYSAAMSGDIIELISDGGIYNETSSIIISGNKNITIRAASGLVSQPVWQSSVSPFMNVGANVTISGITLDGRETSGMRTINLLEGTGFYVVFNGLMIKGFDYVIYGSTAANADSIIIKNCLIKDVSNRCLYFPAGTIEPGIVSRLSIKNSTFMEMKKTEPVIYFYGKSSSVVSPQLELNHVTFYNTQRIRTNSTVTDVSIKNTIFAADGTISGGQSFNLYGGNVNNSLIFNAPVSGSGGTYANLLDNIDPLFTDAANGDLSLSTNSPALNYGDDGKSIGDSRWWPKSGIQVEAGLNKISAALANAEPGDIIQLVTDGGIYEETSTINVDKNITIAAAEGLVDKPIVTAGQGNYLMKVSAGLDLSGIVFDNSKGAILPDSSGYNVIITDCDFSNIAEHVIADNYYSGEIDSLIISGCYFTNITEEGIYLGGHSAPSIGTVKYFSLKNSTFSNTLKDPVYVRDNDGSDATQGPEFIIDHCTFYNASSTYGVLAHHIDGAVVKNCIAAYPQSLGKISFYIYGTNSYVKNCISYNLKTNVHDGHAVNVLTADPLFVDAENGNYKLYRNSPAVNAADDGTTIGDPRWGVSSEVSNQLVFIKKAYSMSPTTTTARIMWETPENAPEGSVVEYGENGVLNKSVTGDAGRLIAGEGYMHEVTISGLQPFTKYWYRVGNGTDFSADTNITKTAPEKGTDFKLMSVSDIHDNDEDVWKNMCDNHLQSDVDMTVLIGDLVNDGSIRTTWDDGFFKPGENLLKNYPITGAIGNHETAFGKTTYYDYFYVPAHPVNDDDAEAYSAMDYGDIKIITLNTNGDTCSPSFSANSAQLLWLEEQLKNADSKWLFIFSHTNVLSTSYHAQWSASEKEYLLPLYEKYAALGKHILVFGGDEHNFEHLYKDGVNYFRPGCANASLRETNLNLADKPYSVFFKKTAGYSTIEVSDSGNVVTLTAQDTAGVPFYTIKLVADGNQPPNFVFTEPDGFDDVSSDVFNIRWADSDPDNNASISLFYTPDSGAIGTLIADNISEDDAENTYAWNVAAITPGSYFIYAVINDSVNPSLTRYASGRVTVIPDTIAPPAVTGFNGIKTSDKKIQLSWVNPVEPVHVETTIADFENGVDDFVGEYEGTATGSLEIVPGIEGSALRINYDISVLWNEFAGVKKFPNLPNFSEKPMLEFYYRGDGSARVMRIIAKQDNDHNGTDDDWWYVENNPLSSTDWQIGSVDLRALSSLSWHTNADKTFDLENMYSLNFIVPGSTIGSGYVELDDIKISGDISPAPDFEGVVVVRRTDRYPQNETDGVIVYQGNAQSCVDTTADVTIVNYYSVFAYDEVPNYSAVDSTSRWNSSAITSVNDNETLPVVFELKQNYPNPFNPSTNIKYSVPKSCRVSVYVFNILGQKVETLVDEIKDAGYYNVTFNASANGKRLASGVYYIRMEAGDYTSVKKLMLLK